MLICLLPGGGLRGVDDMTLDVKLGGHLDGGSGGGVKNVCLRDDMSQKICLNLADL